MWTTPDPIGVLGGVNLYGYVQNNPVNLSTPVSTVLDAAGNIYVANQVHAAIIKIDKAGRVEIVAGGP